MNPDGTNPSTNTGATGGSGAGSVVPPALDFTSSDTTSLSMADSLASAADNLTSAGMAAKEPDSGSIGLGQIGASDPSASMERPDEPLVPAAPVPGSLGSVTSGPAVTASDNMAGGFGASAGGANGFGASAFGASATPSMGAANGTSGMNGSGTGAASGASGFGGGASVSAGAQPTTAGFGAMPTVNAMNGSTGASAGANGFGTSSFGASATPAAGSNGAGSSAGVAGSGANGAVGAGAANEPYNPFAKMKSAAQPTSSTNVPMGSQPATEKFSPKLAGAKKPSLLTVILGILAVVSLVMAIVFAILWQQAEANKEVVYVPPKDDGNVNQTVSMITCTKNLGTSGADVLPGLTNHDLVATVNFSNDQLGSIDLLNKYTFVDNAAAEATRPYFDEQINWYGGIATNLGVKALEASVEIVDVMVNFDAKVVPEQLMGDYIGVFGLVADAEGKVDGSRESIQGNYEANGYVCTEN